MGAASKRLEKINPLCKHYDIDINQDFGTKSMLLVFELAEEFVPGFRIKDATTQRSKGRPKVWDWEKYCQLLADVELLKSEKTRSDSEACLILSSSPRFAMRWSQFNKRTLENRLVKARDENINFVLKLVGSIESSGELPKSRAYELLIECFSITETLD